MTGFDAPTIQTLFVDRNLEYAGLIQVFHARTVRILKRKGLIVTFRKPATMEKNVEDATNCIQKQRRIGFDLSKLSAESKKIQASIW